MPYRIRDDQVPERYFADGKIFETMEDIRLQLIDCHSLDYADCEPTVPIENFTLQDILEYGQWSIEEVKK